MLFYRSMKEKRNAYTTVPMPTTIAGKSTECKNTTHARLNQMQIFAHLEEAKQNRTPRSQILLGSIIGEQNAAPRRNLPRQLTHISH